MSFEIIISCFPNVKPSGKRYRVKCPAHDDSSASLSITQLGDGATRLKCFAGCAPENIMGAIGLDPKLAWRPLMTITNDQWQAKNQYNARISAAISRDIYQIKMIKADLKAGIMSSHIAAIRIKRLSPSVLHINPRTDRETRELAEKCRLDFWAAAIEIVDEMALVELLSIRDAKTFAG